ncbi:MAG: hypothetical protein ACOXZK_04075 [Bacteroidales bacterium]|jgi:hypothetical protein|nr:hypothetical protein [Bacteroidales bacterium]
MKRLLLILVVASSVLFASSCTKSKESKLEGKWRKIVVSNVDTPQPTDIWEFNSGQLIIHRIPIGESEMNEVSRANYSLGFNGTTYTFNITEEVSGAPLYYIMAPGKIVKLNNDQFKYINNNGFYGEFVRY